MPKTPTLPDAEIRSALEAHHERNGRWPTNKEARDLLPGPVGNGRLASILADLRQPIQPSMPFPPAGAPLAISRRLMAAMWAEIEEVGGPHMLGFETVLPAIVGAVDGVWQHCLATDQASDRDAQDRLRAAEAKLRDTENRLLATENRLRAMRAACHELARALGDDPEDDLEPIYA